MAPTEPIQLPFRWVFIPVEDPRDKSIRWKWRAMTQSGELAQESGEFDTRTACEADAQAHGYTRN
jgi:hypothetical protein